ncbi:aminotransferase class III-fold pyridoxal phosphate-dependent enzyme [Crassaminicella thermophila]|uniref:Aminotransferase class III-fold pyridoxal phosphate-dependent enzyme n=1 Tax=Crassaminicella thermophila TaxID=2599308 RepID=A0A5C0SGQ0_CRATE|nr:aminotransferase class III-fold pyridoxal phosphate-dependent enzyme [Crassaminicella thermophila]QEK12926.1 aminotransferase class III-fold pyridoxal phosphate-dependent enzyme [Crassaminicella thermophila]
MSTTSTTLSEVREKDLKYNLHSWSAQAGLKPEVITKAEGIYFWNEEGKRFYDMSSQLVNVNIGHGNKKVIKAIKDQADKIPFIGPAFALDVRAEAAKKIVEIAPDNMAKVFFTNAGAEANENAIKIARMVTGKYKILSAYRSYHGATYGAANLTGEPRRFASEPGIPGFVKFVGPYPYRGPIEFKNEEEATKYYLTLLREQIEYEGPETIAAIFQESVVGSNGILIPPKGWMQGVRDLCNEFGIMMVCDEVMAGWGRTGEWFAINNWNVEPDMITFAKGVTCGYTQLGGVIVSKKIADYFEKNTLWCGLTYSAHPMGCAAACATIDVYKEENLIERSKEMGAVLGEILEDIKAKHACVGDVRYIGLFSAIELVKDKETKEPLVPYGKDPEGVMKKILNMLRSEGFWNYSHENILIVAPPLIIKENELRDAMNIMDNVLDFVDNVIGK